MRSERRTDAGPEGRDSDFQFLPCKTLCEPRGELKPRSRWSGIRTSPIKGDGRIRTELAPSGRGDQALLGSTFVSWFLFDIYFFYKLNTLYTSFITWYGVDFNNFSSSRNSFHTLKEKKGLTAIEFFIRISRNLFVSSSKIPFIL